MKNLSLQIALVIFLFNCSQTSTNKAETEEKQDHKVVNSEYPGSKYQIEDLIRQSDFYPDLTAPLLDSLFSGSAVIINDFLPVNFHKSNPYYASITMSGDGGDSNYEFLMVDGQKGILLMHLWRTGYGVNDKGEEIETKESDDFKLFEVFEGSLIERTEEYFVLEDLGPNLGKVEFFSEQPLQISLNGERLQWDGNVFRVEVQKRFMAMYFQGLLGESQITELLKNGQVETENGGTVLFNGDGSYAEVEVDTQGKKTTIKQYYSPDGSIISYSLVEGDPSKQNQRLLLARHQNGEIKEVTREALKTTNLMYYIEDLDRPFVVSLDRTGLITIEGRAFRFLYGQLEDGLITKSEKMNAIYFQDPFQVGDTAKLIQAFRKKGTLASDIVDILYPAKYRLRLFDQYIGTFWNGDTDILNPDDIRAHDTYSINGYEVFHFSIPIWEQEGLQGSKHLIRVMKDGQMQFEIPDSEGSGFGAMPSTHTVSINLVPGGFVKKKKNVTNFPGTMMWNEAVNLDVATNSGSIQTEYVGFAENGPYIIYDYTEKFVEFGTSSSLKERLENSTSIESIFKEGVRNKEDLTPAERMQVAAILSKLKKDIDGEHHYISPKFDGQSTIESLEVNSYELKATVGDIAIYQVKNIRNKNTVIFFNTLNLLKRGGDAEDEIYEELINIDGRAPYFSIVSGRIEGVKDITGDGVPEIIVNDVSNFRNDFQGGLAVYQINEYNELLKLELPYLDVSFIGGECKQIAGYNTRISFEEDKLKLEMEAGGHDCSNQNYQKRIIYYRWSAEEKTFIKE